MNTFRVTNSLDPDHTDKNVGPDIWVQAGYKGYQQMTVAGKELTISVVPNNHFSSAARYEKKQDMFKG